MLLVSLNEGSVLEAFFPLIVFSLLVDRTLTEQSVPIHSYDTV